MTNFSFNVEPQTVPVFEGRVIDAHSQLKQFSLLSDVGSILLVEAVGDQSAPSLVWRLLPKESGVAHETAACSVDWSWLHGSKLLTIDKTSSKEINLNFDLAGQLTITVFVWKSTPFLSFQPIKRE